MCLSLLHSPIEITIIRTAMVALVGPPAMNICKLRQAWKGATVAETSCAGVWLMRVATQLHLCLFIFDSVLDTSLRDLVKWAIRIPLSPYNVRFRITAFY